MSKYFPIEDDGLDIAIASAVPSKHHGMVVMMLMGQVGRVANLLTEHDIQEMNQKYVKVLLAAKTLGVRSSARLDAAFDLTYADVVTLVDHLVVEPTIPTGVSECGSKEELNRAVRYEFPPTLTAGVTLVTMPVRHLVWATVG